MGIGERIELRREQLRMSRQDLSDRTYIDVKQLWRYEKGKNSPTASVITVIAKELDVSTDWLLGMSDEVKPIHSSDDLSDEEMQLLNIYRSKSPEAQQRLLNVAKVV